MSSIILNSVFGENLRPYSIKKNMRGGIAYDCRISSDAHAKRVSIAD